MHLKTFIIIPLTALCHLFMENILKVFTFQCLYQTWSLPMCFQVLDKLPVNNKILKKAAWISIMGFTTTELLCLVMGVEMLFIVFKTCVLPALITFFNYCHYLLALFIFTTCGAGQRRHHHHHHHRTIHRTVNLLEIFQCRKGKLKLTKFNFMEH